MTAKWNVRAHRTLPRTPLFTGVPAHSVKREGICLHTSFQRSFPSTLYTLALRAQNVTLETPLYTGDSQNLTRLRSQNVTSNIGCGGARYLPYAFTELGVAMLSSVLKSETAIKRAKTKAKTQNRVYTRR